MVENEKSRMVQYAIESRGFLFGGRWVREDGEGGWGNRSGVKSRFSDGTGWTTTSISESLSVGSVQDGRLRRMVGGATVAIDRHRSGGCCWSRV